MKALELLKSKEPLFTIGNIGSKKIKGLASLVNDLIVKMSNQIVIFNEFNNSQLRGDQANKIIIAKSLAEFYSGNKLLKVDLAVNGLKNQEKASMSAYYSVKNKLLETIRTLIKEVSKDAVICNFDIFGDDFVKCQAGHEIIILGDRNVGVLETYIRELDKDLIIEGNFDKTQAQSVDYNLNVLNRNIELCNRKNNELYGNKPGKFNKLESMIKKLRECGEQVVAFYSYKDALLEIGCMKKGVADYENEIKKAYLPIRKILSKELRIQMEEISNVTISDTDYSSYSFNEDTNLSSSDEINNFDELFSSASSNVAEESDSPFTPIDLDNEPIVPTVANNDEDDDDPFIKSIGSQGTPSEEVKKPNPFDDLFGFKATLDTNTTPNSNNDPFDNF